MRLNLVKSLPLLFLIGTTSLAAAEDPRLAVKSYEGQTLILLSLGSSREVDVAKEDLHALHGGCEVAVIVEKAKFTGKKLKFHLRQIGDPSIKKKINSCDVPSLENDITVSRLSGDETAAEISTTVGSFLVTPDRYLQIHEVVLKSSQVGEPREVFGLEDKGITPPSILLGVIPKYPPLERFRGIGGVVKAQVVVAADGRIHDAKIIQSVAPTFDREVLEVLSLWRFEPARKDGRAVSVQKIEEISFTTH